MLHAVPIVYSHFVYSRLQSSQSCSVHITKLNLRWLSWIFKNKTKSELKTSYDCFSSPKQSDPISYRLSQQHPNLSIFHLGSFYPCNYSSLKYFFGLVSSTNSTRAQALSSLFYLLRPLLWWIDTVIKQKIMYKICQACHKIYSKLTLSKGWLRVIPPL